MVYDFLQQTSKIKEDSQFEVIDQDFFFNK